VEQFKYKCGIQQLMFNTMSWLAEQGSL